MFIRISIEESKKLINEEEAIVVDIRDFTSYSNGHIENSLHLDNNNLAEFLSQADKTKPLVVVCYHGNASQGAADYLNQQGFTNTYSMDGGMSEWVLSNKIVS